MKKIFLVVFSVASFSGLWASEFDDALHQALESQNANYSSEKNKELWIGRALSLVSYSAANSVLSYFGANYARPSMQMSIDVSGHYSSKRFFEDRLAALPVDVQKKLKKLALTEGAPNTLGFFLKQQILALLSAGVFSAAEKATGSTLVSDAAMFATYAFFYKKMSMNRAAKTAACQLNVSID